MAPTNNPITRFQRGWSGWQNRRRIDRLARQVAEHARPQPGISPVVVFNASTRLAGLSLNAAFSQLTAWALRLSGAPVIHYVCQAGMSHCILGTNRQDYRQPPPCAACRRYSNLLYQGVQVQGFTFQADSQLTDALRHLDVTALSGFTYPAPEASISAPMPLGQLVLPSLRWALRRHTLVDDEPTRYLLREYIRSAYRVAGEFGRLLQSAAPQSAVIFNGIMYPEAATRWMARQLGVRTYAHEVGFQRYSTFFTAGEPTAYPIDIPAEFELNATQNAQLDAYLEQRFQGKFSMAGIQFWPEMHSLDEALLAKAANFRQIVPVFTNVVYDTSQVHANVIFSQMFAWLDLVLEIIRAHPESLFVIRAHPDEMRPGTAKQSNESVRQWVEDNAVTSLPNVVFIDSQEYLSSYELIQRSKFVMVYNSSIGMEATLMGSAVLCAGKARYTQYPIVFFPQSVSAFRRQAEEFLNASEVKPPAEFIRNARRFLYYQLYRTSLPLDDYIQTAPRMGFVEFKNFSWQQLLPENSPTLQLLVDGILHQQPFLLPALPA